ncbi:hypothetical protein ABTN16_19880, partial [Acinetobacter baumannii]
MLDLQTTENGYTEINPPVLVNEDAFFGTGQLPKFGQDSFATFRTLWPRDRKEEQLARVRAELARARREGDVERIRVLED